MRIKLIIIAVVTAIFIGVLWWLLAMWGQTQLETELEEAQKAYEAGYNDRMVEQLEMAVARDPDSINTLQIQARLLDAIENAGCLPVYEHLSELQPDDITAFRDWMGALVRYGRLDEARSIYEKFEAAGPPLGGTASFSRLGADLAGTARDENARLAYLREAYERAPDDAEVGVELSRAETQVLPAADLGATVQRLDSLLGQDQVRVEAAALLLQIETALGDKQRLQSAAQRVWDAGAGEVSMRLLALEAFYDLNREDFEQRLKKLIIEEQRNVPALTSIFNWLLARGENELIISLAMEDKAVMNINRPPVANRVAEAMVQTDQLKALRAYNSRVDWTGAEGFASLLPPLTLTLDREEARDVPNPAFTRWLSSAALPQLREVLPVTARLGFEREE
ncbi:MAG: tetratricopeptide repeat protein, partial [Puniceicoccales bacterium]